MSATTTSTRQGASMQRGAVGPYSLRNARGHETINGYAWTATVYREGTRIGFAEQTGTGGMTLVSIGGEEGAEFYRYAREVWNVEKFYDGGSFMQNTDDGFAESLYEEADILRRLNADRRKGNLPVLLAADLPEIETYDVLTAWRPIRGCVNDIDGVRHALRERGDADGALYFDGTSWVPFI